MDLEQDARENDSHEISGPSQDNGKDTICKDTKDEDNNSGGNKGISSSQNKEQNPQDLQIDQLNDNELKIVKNLENVDKETKPGRTEISTAKEEASRRSRTPSSPVKSVKMRKSRDYTEDTKDKESLYSSSNAIYTTFSMSEDFSVSNNGEDSIRITGYLEKRSKMLGWKKYWCVLDGRLLTYYKSKAEYDSLSACCGSINLGIASTVRPIQIRGCKGYPIQIVTRTQVYYLRSLDKQILEQWLIAIQESASSQPKISLPVWADPGSQFFRYSFAALSQWSLDASTEDITESLSTLPQNFYLKRGKETKRQPNHLHKCHSFASLQSPSAYSPTPLKNAIKNNTVQIRNKKEALPGQVKVRQSTSMLMLESSTQAAELRKELARKLSVGTAHADKAFKPMLKGTSKSDLPFLKSPPQVDPNDELHHYDEIVDIEAIYENYEPCDDDGSSSEGLNRHSSSGQHDTGIYESVEAMDDNPWERIDKDPTDSKIDEPRNAKNRNSAGSKRNSLVSNTDESSHKQNANRTFPALPDPPSQSRQEVVSRPSIASIDSDNYSNDSYGDASVTTEKQSKKWKTKAFAGFLHKIFHKDKGKKSKVTAPLVITGPVDLRSLHHQSQQSPINRPTNLPIDKCDGYSTLQKPAPCVGSKPAFNNENVMDELKIKVDQRNRNASKSNDISPRSLTDKPNLRSPVIPTPSLVEKLAIKSGKIPMDESVNYTALISKAVKSTDTDEMTPLSTENREEVLTEPVTQRRQNSEEFQQKLAKFNTLSQRLSTSFAAALNPAPINPTVGALGRSNSCRIQKTIQASKEDKSPPLPPKKKHGPPVTKPNYYDYPTNNQPISWKSSGASEDSGCGVLDSKDTKTSQEINEAILNVRSLRKKNSAPDVIFSSSRSSSGESRGTSKENVDNLFEEFLGPPPPIPPKAKSPIVSPTHEFADPMHYKSPPKRDSSSNEVPKDTIASSPKNFENGTSIESQQNKNCMNSAKEAYISKGALLMCCTKLSPSISLKSSDLNNLDALSDFSDTNASITPPASPKDKVSVSEEVHSEEQDSLISASLSSESRGFITDSLSNTPDDRSKLTENNNLVNGAHEQDSRNNLQIFIHDNDGSSPVQTKSREDMDSLEVSSISSHCLSEGDSIYENLRFATVNTLVQEFETVEETEDEISEMYDDFPTEFLTAVTLTGSQDSSSASPSSSSSTPSPSSESQSDHKSDPVRHSGIDQLQEYLRMESNNSLIVNEDLKTDEDSKNNSIPQFNNVPLRPGAVSRLGHSSAVDQLQRVLRTRSDV